MPITFRVHGRVQGVGFRQFTREAARRLGLAGWVANAPDGTVVGGAEGTSAALAAFRESLSQGPPFGNVTRLEWTELDGTALLPPESSPRPFEIRRA
jgi:acylphosphatase